MEGASLTVGPIRKPIALQTSISDGLGKQAFIKQIARFSTRMGARNA